MSDIAKVTAVESQGLTRPRCHWIPLGTAGQAARAPSARASTSYCVNGETHFANVDEPSTRRIRRVVGGFSA
jgi:hypothetical protein